MKFIVSMASNAGAPDLPGVQSEVVARPCSNGVDTWNYGFHTVELDPATLMDIVAKHSSIIIYAPKEDEGYPDNLPHLCIYDGYVE